MTVTIHAFPPELIRPETCKFYLGRKHLLSNNPWTAFTRLNGPLDERWMAEFSLDQLEKQEWSQLEAMFNSMDGMAGFVTFHDPARLYPRGDATGSTPEGTGFNSDLSGNIFASGVTFTSASPTCTVYQDAVMGASSLVLTGLTASRALSLRANDLFALTVGGQTFGHLHTVLADAASDSSGRTTVNIRPRLRTNIAAGDIVYLHRPTGVFRLQTEESSIVERSYPRFGAVGLTLVEVPEALVLAATEGLAVI